MVSLYRKLRPKKVVFFDLDSTIADTQHRHHLAPEDPANGDWIPYSTSCYDDKPILSTVALINEFKKTCRIVIVTGRTEVAKPQTLEWLARNNIYYDEIHMRSRGNQSESNPDLKVRVISGWLWRNLHYRAVVMFDDYAPVSRAFRKYNESLKSYPSIQFNPVRLPQVVIVNPLYNTSYKTDEVLL